MSTPESPTHIFISQFRSSCGKLWALERFETPPTTYPYLWNVRLRTRQSRGVGAGSNFQGHEDAERAMKPSSGVDLTHIEPLNENLNKCWFWHLQNCVLIRMISSRVVEDEWANITRTQGSGVGSEGPTTSRALNTCLVCCI